MALITDIWCPARDYPIDLLPGEDRYRPFFWDSLAPVSCLFNLLLSGVVYAGWRCRNAWQITDNKANKSVLMNVVLVLVVPEESQLIDVRKPFHAAYRSEIRDRR